LFRNYQLFINNEFSLSLQNGYIFLIVNNSKNFSKNVINGNVSASHVKVKIDYFKYWVSTLPLHNCYLLTTMMNIIFS